MNTGDLQTAARLHALADFEDQKLVQKTVSADVAAVVEAALARALNPERPRAVAVAKTSAPASLAEAVGRIVNQRNGVHKSSGGSMERVVANAAVHAGGGPALLTKSREPDRDGSLVRQALADMRGEAP